MIVQEKCNNAGKRQQAASGHSFFAAARMGWEIYSLVCPTILEAFFAKMHAYAGRESLCECAMILYCSIVLFCYICSISRLPENFSIPTHCKTL